jgi:phage FluMu protein Com
MRGREFGNGAEWYLTIRCTSVMCGRLIAFQKAAYPGDRPNLRFAISGEPSVHCPHCRKLIQIQINQIKRRRIVLTH